jgi:antitoxin FitA-like protein
MGSTETKERLVRGVVTEAPKRALRQTKRGAVRRTMPEDIEMARMVVYVPDDMVRWLRHRAVDHGRSVSDMVRDILETYRRSHTAGV